MNNIYGKQYSPRKAMAMGDAKTDFGVAGFPSSGAKAHPDHSSNVGQAGAMADGDRAVGMPIDHAKGFHPAQSAPMHGPMHDGFRRDGKA